VEFSVQVLGVRHLLDAWAAPTRPKIDEDNLAPVLCQCDLGPRDTLSGKFRRAIADIDAGNASAAAQERENNSEREVQEISHGELQQWPTLPIRSARREASPHHSPFS